MSRDSFVFYKSFYEAVKNIPETSQLEVYKSIFEYCFNDVIPDTNDGIAKAMFILMKPNIDNANARYQASVENGKKGGRPKKQKPIENLEKPKNNLDETQEKPNENLNDNVYVYDDVYENENDNLNENDNKTAKKIINYQAYVDKYHQRCTKLPKLRVLTDKRKGYIKTFTKTFTLEQFEEICDKANRSDFLTGKNDRGWKADFDFLLRIDKATAILEGGKYANKNENNNGVVLDSQGRKFCMTEQEDILPF